MTDGHCAQIKKFIALRKSVRPKKMLGVVRPRDSTSDEGLSTPKRKSAKTNAPSPATPSILRRKDTPRKDQSASVRFTDVKVSYYDCRMASCLREQPLEWVKIFHTGSKDTVDRLVTLVADTLLPNSILDLEKAGARLSSVKELDRFFGGDNIGIRFLVDEKDIKGNRDLIEETLRKYVDGSLMKSLADEDLSNLMSECFAEDRKDALRVKQNLVAKELSIRGMDVHGNLDKQLAALRKRIESEEKSSESCESTTPTSGMDVLKKGLCYRLGCVGLPENGTLEELAMRLEMWRLLHRMCKVKFADVDLRAMKNEEIIQALAERNIIMTNADNRATIAERLQHAWTEESNKFPLRYEYGSTAIDVEELDELEPAWVAFMAESLDPKLKHVGYVVQLSLLKQLIVRQSEFAMVETLKDWISEITGVQSSAHTTVDSEDIQRVLNDQDENTDNDEQDVPLIDTLAAAEKALKEHWKHVHPEDCTAFLCSKLSSLRNYMNLASSSN